MASTQELDGPGDVRSPKETLSLAGHTCWPSCFGRQHDELHHFRRHNEELSRFAVRQRMIAQSFYNTATAFLTLSPALVYLAGRIPDLYRRCRARPRPGPLSPSRHCRPSLYRPVESGCCRCRWNCRLPMALFERIFGYLDMEQDIVDATGCPSPWSATRVQGRGGVRLGAGQPTGGRRAEIGTLNSTPEPWPCLRGGRGSARANVVAGRGKPAASNRVSWPPSLAPAAPARRPSPPWCRGCTT